MTLRPVLTPVLTRLVDELAAPGPRSITLDELGDAIGAAAISVEEIDLVITTLEERGIAVGDEPARPASTHLGTVLRAARQLRSELGRTPSPEEIAQRSDLSTDEVRLALFAAQILQR